MNRLLQSASWLALLACLAATEDGHAGPDLSGTYAYLLQTETITKLPVVQDYVAKTRSIALVQLTQDGELLRGSGQVCSIVIQGSSSVVRTVLPLAFQRSLPPVILNARLSSTGGRLEFYQPPQTLVIGAKLKSSLSEPLPSDPQDPRVFDQDRDGKPGVTVRVQGLVSGDVYVVQRSTSSLSGTQTPGGFSGGVDFRTEQKIIGATSAFLKGNKVAQPNLAGSFFRLQRLSPGATCGDAEKQMAGVVRRPATQAK